MLGFFECVVSWGLDCETISRKPGGFLAQVCCRTISYSSIAFLLLNLPVNLPVLVPYRGSISHLASSNFKINQQNPAML